MPSTRSAWILSVALALVLPFVAPAQTAPERKELKRVDLDGAPGMEVITSITEYKPGDLLPAHLHHGVESLYVVQGAMIQLPGKPAAMLATGTAITNLRDVMHGGFTIVGETSLKLLTVHIVDKGKPLYDVAK